MGGGDSELATGDVRRLFLVPFGLGILPSPKGPSTS